MKRNTKKLLFGLGLALLGNFANAQSGLEGIVVEKYYKANAADAASATDPVPAGSVTYRVYVNLAPGYKLIQVYGENSPGVFNHELKFQTTTSFFNNQDRGAVTANGVANGFLDENTVAIDSWLSLGAAGDNQAGVLKSEDDGAANKLFPHNPTGLLANTSVPVGIPLATQDGMIAGTPAGVAFIGQADANKDVFGSTGGSSFVVNDGSYYNIATGATGPNASNLVLIGQFTTDGEFHYELNLQVDLIAGGAPENWVASDPQSGEFTLAALSGTLGVAPEVNITSPTASQNFFVGNPVSIAADAVDTLDAGAVTQVEFFLDGVSKGVDASSAYTSSTFTITAGSHTVTAVATDNDGNTTTSAPVVINGVVNNLPSVSITSPTAGTHFTGDSAGTVPADIVAIVATASDVDGTIDSVAFFVGGVRVGSATGPFTFNWQIPNGVYGTQNITAKAYDNDGAITTSSVVSIIIDNINAKPYFVENSTSTCVATGFCLPIKAKDTISNVIGFDMTLHYDKNMVTPTGSIAANDDLIPGHANWVTISKNIDAVAGTIDISVAFNNQAPVNTFFSGVGEIICVGFNKTANFTSIDTASFSMDSIAESRISGVTKVAVDAGDYITYKDSTFHAVLQFWADNSAIKYDTANPASYLKTDIYTNNVACSNQSSVSVQPTLAGEFNYMVSSAQVGNLTFNINRDVDGAASVQSVVNGFDALLTQKVIVEDPSFVPSAYQMIAMDVNLDGVISSGDVSQLNQRSVLLIPEFKQAWNYNDNGTSNGAGASRDWVFIDQTTANTNADYLISSIFPLSDGIGYSRVNSPVPDTCLAVNVSDPTGCPVISSEIYTGVMLGDVNGNYKNIAADGVLRSATKVVFDLTNATVVDGKVMVPVSIVSDETVNSLDFAVKMDDAINYDSFISYMLTADAMANLNAADATLRFTSFSFDNYTVGQPVVAVVYDADSLSTADFRETAAYVNGEEVVVEVKGKTTSALGVTDGSALVQVYPNPAVNTVNVLSSEDATAQLIDVNGNVIIEFSVSANQVQTVNTANIASALYTLKVSNNNFVSVSKVVIAK